MDIGLAVTIGFVLFLCLLVSGGQSGRVRINSRPETPRPADPPAGAKPQASTEERSK